MSYFRARGTFDLSLPLGSDEAGAEDPAPQTMADLVRLQQDQAAQLAKILESQKREEKLRLIATVAAVVGGAVAIVRLGDVLRQLRRKRSDS